MNTINQNSTGVSLLSSDKKRIKKASYIGSALGVAAAVGGIYAMSKKGNPDIKLKNLHFEERDMITLGAGSIAGGLAGGLITDKNKDNQKAKIREGIQQFFGSLLCPIALIGLGEKLLDKSKFKMPQMKSASKTVNDLISSAPKIATTVGALVLGMNIGNKVVNKINNKIFKEEKTHDVKPSDYLLHTDDLCFALSLIFKDVKSIQTVIPKILPLAFIPVGAKTGLAEADKIKS